MASKLYVTEFRRVAGIGNAPTGVTLRPLRTQVVDYSGGTAATAAAVGTDCEIVRVFTDTICSVEVGTAPTATTSSMPMAAESDWWFAVEGSEKGTIKVAAVGGR